MIISLKDLSKNLKKKFWLCSSIFSLFLIVAILTDEYVKEGYFFRINEFTLIFSHEFFVTILAVYSVFAYIMHRTKQRRGDA